MDSIELLVHISASASRRDDRKYLDLAQSIIDFEPATVIKPADLKGSDLASPRDEDLLQTQLLSSSPDCNRYHSQPVGSGASFVLESLSGNGLTHATKTDGATARRQPSSDNPNPPYKNPYHGPPRFWKPHGPYETPGQTRRPKTAPEKSSSTVQVPRTVHYTRRRHSDSASFGSLASHISNSQPSTTSGVEDEDGFTMLPTPSFLRGGAGEPHGGVIRSLSQTSLADEVRPSKRARTLVETDDQPTRIPRPVGTEAFLLRDRSLDWTPSPQSTEVPSSSIPSTATPSQPFPDHGHQPHSPSKPSPTVVLLSSESSKQAGQSFEQQAELTASVIEQQPGRNPLTSCDAGLTSQVTVPTSFFEGLGLKLAVTAPQPGVGSERFVSHVTAPLREFARQLSFERFFRPISVTRDVNVLERGHWLMEVTIVSDQVAEAARSVPVDEKRVPTMQERFQGATAVERLQMYDEAKRNGSLYQFGQNSESRAQGLWTEQELVQFWKNFSSFIEDGKAGWGIRLVGETLSGDESEEDRKVRIRVFTWGEVLGHIYLAMWVLSDKLCARIPMEWISSDGTSIVKMAGTRSGRGLLPAWSRKGPEGEKGCWGV